MAYEVQNFQEDVIEASHTRPVLVDFWAPWCGPCRVLGPVLEKLAGESTDQWSLVKVNSDLHQDLSMQYGIRGIPAVKLFFKGEVIDEFTGALPEYAVRQWLEKALPSKAKDQLQQAENAFAMGDYEQAEQLLNEVLLESPNMPQAQAMLAELVVFSDPERAATLAEGAVTAEPHFVQVGETVSTIAGLLKAQKDPDSLPDDPAKETYIAALDALAAQDLDAALNHFIQVIQMNRFYHDDSSRKASIAIFNLLGPQHEVTRKHRRMFDMVLY